MSFETLERAGEVVGYFNRAEEPLDHLAVFLPPATGRLEPLMEEALTLGNSHVSSLVLTPLYVRARARTFTRGPESPAGEKLFWIENAQEIAKTIQEARTRFGLRGKTVGLGKNLGGSYGVFVMPYFKFDFFLAFGSIPSLTEFWSSSDHPIARNLREGKEHLLPAFIEEMRPVDLLHGLQWGSQWHRSSAFLQLGTKDEWIDPSQKAAVSKAPFLAGRVRWYDDDHEMQAPQTRSDRLGMVLRWLEIGEDLVSKGIQLKSQHEDGLRRHAEISRESR